MGLRFYSRLPTGRFPHEQPDLDRIAPLLPIASAVIGLGPFAVLLAASWSNLPAAFAVLLAIACSAVITGAMSYDAAADAADGLFGGATPERRLAIMRDSRHGTYGVLAIVFLVGLKAAALWPVAAGDAYVAGVLWLAAGILARSGALWLALALPPARPDGAAATAGQISRNAFVIGLVLALAVAYILSVGFIGLSGFVIAVALGCAVIFAWARLCKRLAGGSTGDLIGALQALLEVTLIAVFAHAFLG